MAETPGTSPRKRQRSTKKTQTISLLTDDEASPTGNRKLPVRTKDGDEEAPQIHTHLAVEIPVSKLVPGSATRSTRSKQAGKIPDTEPRAVAEIQDSEFDEEEFESPVKLKSPGNVKMSPGKAEESKKDVGKSSSAAPRTVEPKHKRFGSQEPGFEGLIPTSKEESIDEVESDAGDSDDDGPEEVVTQDAEERVKKSLRDTARALEE